MSDTPRTDKECERTDRDYYLDGYVWAEFARELERELALKQQDYDHERIMREQLERELSEAKKPPPCQHNHQSGWVKGSEWGARCDDCGADLNPEGITATQKYMMALK